MWCNHRSRKQLLKSFPNEKLSFVLGFEEIAHKYVLLKSFNSTQSGLFNDDVDDGSLVSPPVCISAIASEKVERSREGEMRIQTEFLSQVKYFRKVLG